MSEPATPSPDANLPESLSEAALKLRDLEVRAGETRVKEEELAVRRLEAAVAQRTAAAPWWRNPNNFLIAIVAGAATLGGNLLVATYNGYSSRAAEETRASNELAVEKTKDQAQLLLAAIATTDPARAYANIQFFTSSGVLPDPDSKILDAAEAYAPSLPAADSTGNAIPDGSQFVSAQDITHLADRGLTLGITVSHNNGAPDFVRLKQIGIRFVYIKATQGTAFVDPKTNDFVEAAEKAGLKVGLYHFFVGADGGDTEARNFIDRLAVIHWELPPVIDCEADPGLQPSPDPAVYAARLHKLATMVEKKFGVTPIIYTANGFASQYLNQSFSKYPLFIAQYTPHGRAPTIPPWWSNYLFFNSQYGISDAPYLQGFDIDLFRGSTSDLDKLANERSK